MAKVIKVPPCRLCRANDKDVNGTIPGRETSASTPSSPPARCMKMKLRMTPDQVFEQAKLSVRYARRLPDVEFLPEDASRRVDSAASSRR